MFAVLHVADFALCAVLRTAPDAHGTAAALFAGVGKKSTILAATPAARTAGVEIGMTAPQAVARCPALLIRSPSATAEAESRAALLALGFTLSPSIEDTAPGICTIDLRGLPRDKYAPATHTAISELARLGLPATAGIARTPLLALYAARATASVLFVDAEKNFLAPLPLATADPSPGLAPVLADWGLRTLGDLTALPRDEIVRRFGAEGLALWQRATGGAPRPLRPVTPSPTFGAGLEFENEIETLEPLLFVLRRFLDRLTLELAAAQLVAAEIELAFRLEDDTRHTRRFRLPEPTADADILLRALHTHLESLQTAAAIRTVQLRLVPTRPLVRQQGLFETGLRDPHGFAETLARLVALLGPEHVGTPQLETTHRPDAVKLTPPLAVVPPPAPPPLHAPLGLPLHRFRPPVPAHVEFTGGQPTYLWSERVHGEIAFHSPAYRSSGDWWQADRAWSRTEWDIALALGGVYRLLLVRQAYFVEGEYG
ncbi:MAG: DNA polymerase Y family protein [Verrucomicrobia bacterium]|nr:DNA polymerase Y family protein [Verrucomicrobiota bacterium]